jgi:hypothetical protein
MAKVIEWVPWDNSAPKAVKRKGAHSFTGRIVKWNYCARCGLIALRNSAPKQAERQQCEWEE